MLRAPQEWCHERECVIYDHCAPDISRHGRHGRDSHPVAFAANLPAGCKNYRAAPAGFPRCGTCNIYIGDAFVGKHFSNRRHIYLRGIAKQKESDFLISSPRTGPDTHTAGPTHQPHNSSHHGEDPRTPSISSAFHAPPVPGDWLLRCDPHTTSNRDPRPPTGVGNKAGTVNVWGAVFDFPKSTTEELYGPVVSMCITRYSSMFPPLHASFNDR